MADKFSYTTIVTAKGQITVPKPVRDKLGIRPGVVIDLYSSVDGFIGKPRLNAPPWATKEHD